MENGTEEELRLLTAYASALPKVELHAHLNGCVRDKTLRCVLAERSC
jgi:adenosine deaminase